MGEILGELSLWLWWFKVHWSTCTRTHENKGINTNWYQQTATDIRRDIQFTWPSLPLCPSQRSCSYASPQGTCSGHTWRTLLAAPGQPVKTESREWWGSPNTGTLQENEGQVWGKRCDWREGMRRRESRTAACAAYIHARKTPQHAAASLPRAPVSYQKPERGRRLEGDWAEPGDIISFCSG